MSRPRSCPHCNKRIPPDEGFTFDTNLNLICVNCNRIAFPSCYDGETQFDSAFKKPVVTTEQSFDINRFPYLTAETKYYPSTYRPPSSAARSFEGTRNNNPASYVELPEI